MPSHYGGNGMSKGRSMKKNSPKENKPKRKKAEKKTTIKLGDEKIKIKPNALRNQLKVPEGKNIPMALINKILKAEVGDEIDNPFGGKVKITALLKRRANLGKTLKKM